VKRLLSISPATASFTARGFHTVSAGARETLEGHAVNFITGYNAALANRDVYALAAELEDVVACERGFAYEGAGMAYAILDLLVPGRRDRLAGLLAGPGAPHVYMVHIGAGWALARLRLRPRGRLPALDPSLRWLALDGYGFHEGFFHTRDYVTARRISRRLSGYEFRAFDQGLGRSLWFVEGGDVERAATTIGSFPHARRPDLWSGLALACTYTAVASRRELEELRRLGAEYCPQLAQGAAFAIVQRHLAGNATGHTRTAAAVLCGAGIEDVAETVAGTLAGTGPDPDGAVYEAARDRLGQLLARSVSPAP
jgi:hypothetical protein